MSDYYKMHKIETIRDHFVDPGMYIDTVLKKNLLKL
jgi:hypothetical protein